MEGPRAALDCRDHRKTCRGLRKLVSTRDGNVRSEPALRAPYRTDAEPYINCPNAHYDGFHSYYAALEYYLCVKGVGDVYVVT